MSRLSDKDRRIALLVILNMVLAAALGTVIGMYVKSGGLDDTRDAVTLDQVFAQIGALADSIDARVGVAVIFEDGDTLSYAGGDIFPMLSVFKFHQALAVCDCLRSSGRSLTDKVNLGRNDLAEDTWSPLRDEYPEGGSFSFAELLDRTLRQSDNNVSDFFFRTLCDIGSTDNYIRSEGIGDFAISCDEQMMHEDPSRCYDNWTTPVSAAVLLDRFYKVRDLDEYNAFIWQTMTLCDTGRARIPKYISGNAIQIAHKTGTGFTLPDGTRTADNDAGAITLPDGHRIYIAVLIKDTRLGDEANARLMADIARVVIGHTAKGVKGVKEIKGVKDITFNCHIQ